MRRIRATQTLVCTLLTVGWVACGAGTPAPMPAPPPPTPRAEPAPTVAEVPAPPARPTPKQPSATYYVSDCGPGADPDCIPGDDRASGRDPSRPWRSYERAREAFSNLQPGETIAFARGGAFPHSGRYRWNAVRCRADAPCTLDDYTPPWASGDEPRPRILGGSYGFDFSSPGRPRHHEGYVLRDLIITGNPEGDHSRRWGLFFHNDIDDVLLENLLIEKFAIGINLVNGEGDETCERITLRRSRVVDNSRQGWLGGSAGTRIEDNHFENNGFGARSTHAALRRHNLYFSESSTGAVIRGNTLTRASQTDHDGSPTTPPVCHATSLVVHGHHRGLVIEENLVHEEPGRARPECWGIVADGGAGFDAFPDLVIRRNRVVNVGSVSIGCTSCSDALIENNVVVQENALDATGISIPTKKRMKSDGPTSHVRVLHNSLYFAGGEARGIRLREAGQGGMIAGNAVAHAGRGRLICFEADRAGTGYERIDHNICFDRGDGVRWVRDGRKTLSLGAWQAASGHDAHSAVRDPRYAAPAAPDFDLALTRDSAGLLDAADPSRCPSEDIDGAPRPQGGGCDIGAFELEVGGVADLAR